MAAHPQKRVAQGAAGGRRGFSLPELLVVIGVILLLLAILSPPVLLARRQAMVARCAGNLQQIGVALESLFSDYEYYPLWDDGGYPVRYTWIDVLVQDRRLSTCKSGYCPEGPPPSNSLTGPPPPGTPGSENLYRPSVEYSYGIGVPLSAGGWNWRPGFGPPGDDRPRRFEGHQRNPSQRVLAADSNWTAIYNVSGYALLGHDWSYPTQYDNTVQWRHRGPSANFLYQDGHVARVVYRADQAEPVNTVQTCVWYPGEPVNVGPEHEYRGNWYPDVPPVNLTGDLNGVMPPEVIPAYYTRNLLWTDVRGQ